MKYKWSEETKQNELFQTKGQGQKKNNSKIKAKAKNEKDIKIEKNKKNVKRKTYLPVLY